MNIQIGTKFSLKLKDRNNIIIGFYVGEKVGKHIVLTISNEDLSCFKENTEVVMQYSEGEYRYEFSSNVIAVLDDPADLLVMTCPGEVVPVDKRALCRINCLISAKLKNRSDGDIQTISGVIENISKTGCLCKAECSDVPFSIDESVNISCQFPGLMGEQDADGKIIRIIDEAKNIVMGIQFDEKAWWVPPYNIK